MGLDGFGGEGLEGRGHWRAGEDGAGRNGWIGGAWWSRRVLTFQGD